MIHLPLPGEYICRPACPSFEQMLANYRGVAHVSAYLTDSGVRYRFQTPGTAGSFISRERAEELLKEAWSQSVSARPRRLLL